MKLYLVPILGNSEGSESGLGFRVLTVYICLRYFAAFPPSILKQLGMRVPVKWQLESSFVSGNLFARKCVRSGIPAFFFIIIVILCRQGAPRQCDTSLNKFEAKKIRNGSLGKGDERARRNEFPTMAQKHHSHVSF